jgi:NAD(P)-dependent dehydrogenase (short-subunit alcohol dehydrogenase family)
MSKILLVTGGSRGIGAATCYAAARDGWRVVVHYRSAADAAEAVAAGIRAGGGEAEAIGGDVASEPDVKAIFTYCKRRYGRLDGLVNNAGILPQIGRLADFDLARWNRTFAVNATGTFLCCREAVRMMSPQYGGQGGAIVNLSSMAAVLGAPNEFIDYGASKGAVESLTTGLARELGPDGIRVNAVRPGLISTDIHKSSGDAARVERLAGGVPLGRPGTPEETAAAIIWLLSEAASYVTGSVIAVSGGR